ncbi:sublancin family glycopeptide [Clostridium sporogenes]|uniref:sublancin family glycopeptide n=1 Tax=Clostridium sporogenes TaxID=1509 RepID=UPI0013D7F178|nr:sublancin family glycopeptide [Clostridium sporogenes]
MKDLMKDLNLKELEDCNGGRDFTKGQCAALFASCASQAGCGGYGACLAYQQYCR